MGWPNEDNIPMTEQETPFDHESLIRDILKKCGKSAFEIEDFLQNIDSHTDDAGFITIYDETDDTMIQMKF